MRTVNHYSKRMLALLLVCVLCINLFIGVGSLQRVAAAEAAASGVDLMNSASFGGKAGVLSYDVNKKEGWIGGNGITASNDLPARYFTYNTYGDVIVDGKEVPLASCEITYSVTFSNIAYDASNTSGVRGQGVILQLQYNDGTKNWTLENRFGGTMYGSGHYMQILGTGSTLLANNAGAPFYSESVKNSVANFPALAEGDTISLKVKCATDTENGYIKLLINGEEKHTFIYTGTKLPDFGLKANKLMAKMTNISLTVEGATRWSQCPSHVESEQIVDVQPTYQAAGSWHTECTNCGQTINSGTIPALVGFELMNENACLSNPKLGVLTYDVAAKEGWIGGDGTTASTDEPARYFSFPIYNDVLVNDEAVPYESREVTYSVTVSNLNYDTAKYPSGVRQQAVILMLLVKSDEGNWLLENRFGGQMYASGHYMQVWKPNSTAGAGSVLQDVGAPFYSTTKNSIANFPALANGDTISLKVKCATETENGYIKLLLNGEEKHTFTYTGTKMPDFGLKANKLMAKVSDVSIVVDGATGWAPCEHTPGEVTKENEKPADCVTPGSYESVVKCIFCGEEVSRETVMIDALGHTYDDDQDTDCNVCGDVREVAPAGPEKADDLVFLQAPSLSFQDYIGMQLLINGALANTYDEIYVEAVQVDPTAGAITTKLVGSPYYGVYLLFDQQILSWSMTENVTLTLYGVKDGKTFVGQSYSASVESLALSMLAKNASNEKICRVLVDMLNYGAAVQTTFNHNAAYLPNTQLGEFADKGTSGTPEMSATSSETGSGSVAILQTSTSMQSKVEIQFLFAQNISAYEAKAAIGETALNAVVDTETMAAYGYTIVRVAIGAANMRDVVTFALYDTNGNPVTVVKSVSVEALVKNQVNGAQGAVIVAMMHYGDAVAAYAGK